MNANSLLFYHLCTFTCEDFCGPKIFAKVRGSSTSCSALKLNKASGLKCGKNSHFFTVMLLAHTELVNHHYWDRTTFLRSAFLEPSHIYVCNQLFIRLPLTLASCWKMPFGKHWLMCSQCTVWRADSGVAGVDGIYVLMSTPLCHSSSAG